MRMQLTSLGINLPQSCRKLLRITISQTSGRCRRAAAFLNEAKGLITYDLADVIRPFIQTNRKKMTVTWIELRA